MEMPRLPPAYLSRVEQQFPGELEALVRALGEAPSIGVRYNPAKISEAPFYGRPIPWCREGFVLAERPLFTLDPRWHAGAYYVQEPSSMAIALALKTWERDSLAATETDPLRRSRRILDLCAAPGGKSTLLAAWKSPQDLLLANEVVPARRIILRENMQKWGALGCYVGAFAPADVPGDGAWDVVLVDAPCSGEGLFRREPIARSQWSRELIATCASLQEDILSQAVRLLAPGGLLIYSTCTSSPEENQVNSDRLAREASFEVLSLPELPESGWVEQGVGYLALPHRVDGEGFFVSCFRKTGQTQPEAIADESPEPTLRITSDEIRSAFSISWDERFVAHTDPQFDSLTLELPEHLRFWRKPSPSIRKSGKRVATLARKDAIPESTASLAERKGKSWLPTPASALLSDITHYGEKLEVATDTALQLLKGEAPASALSATVGWTLIYADELPLMWSKQMGNRYNSLWPKPWRIRMRIDR